MHVWISLVKHRFLARVQMMSSRFSRVVLPAVLLAVAAVPVDASRLNEAAGLLGAAAWTGGASGTSALDLPALDEAGAENLAGILQFCLSNGYTGDNSVRGVIEQLTGQAGGEEALSQNTFYQDGLRGVLGGTSEGRLDLTTLTRSRQLTGVCAKVLNYCRAGQ